MHACNMHIKRPKFMHVTCTNMHDISCSVHVACTTFGIKSYSFSLCSLWGGAFCKITIIIYIFIN